MTLQGIQYKAQAIIQKWRDEDSAPYVEFVEELALMDVPELPSVLEEAAEEYNKQVIEETKCHHNALTYAEGYEDALLLIPDAFIAGAEYQRKQDQQLIELAEDHAMLAGMNKMKEEMMEKAVEGRVFMSFAPGHNQMVMADVDLPTNTKVRVIVIPEENLNTIQNEN